LSAPGPASAPAAPYRARVLEALLAPLRADERVRGCWEGGSVAMGRADAYSDIDLYVVTETSAVDAVFAAIEAALATVDRVTHTWRVEPPAFPGFTQCFYFLAGAPRWFVVDCALVTPAGAASFLERERHGEPVVYIDRDGTVAPRPLDRGAHDERLARRLEQIRAAWPLYLAVVEKELARDNRLDAIGFYFGGLLRQLVELVGMRYRPDRFDYGWRHLHRDVPDHVQRRLESFATLAGVAHIAGHLEEIDRMAQGLLADLAAGPRRPNADS
jgi:hypothetical protein